MREFYFVVEPTVRKPEKDMRVYKVEKTRKEEGSYREAARLAGGDTAMGKRNKTRQNRDGIANTSQESSIQNHGLDTLQEELLMQHTISLEERQEQLRYQKREQKSSSRRSQMLAAYGK